MEKQQGLASTGQQDIEQVVQLLMQGATPEELLQMGVPEEVIMQAIEMLKQAQAQQQSQQQPQTGLAGMATNAQV